MKKTYLFGAAVAVIAAVLSPAAAYAADAVTDAVASLNDGHTYVAPGANGSGLNTFDGTDVAVVVTPVNGNSILTPSQLAGQIYGEVSGKYKTVIVVNSDSSSNITYGVAPTGASEKVLPILSDNGAVVPGLVSDKSELIAAVQQPTPTGSGDSGSALGTVAAFGGALIGVAALVAVFMFFKNRGRGSSSSDSSYDLGKLLDSEEMEKAAERLQQLQRKHAKAGHPTGAKLESTIQHLSELFARLEKKSTQQQKRLAEVEYANTIDKLNNALGEDYYLDIAAKPNLWSNPYERLKEVQSAVDAVDNQILLNIRQVNSAKDLDLRVGLEAILATIETDDPNAMTTPKKKSRRSW